MHDPLPLDRWPEEDQPILKVRDARPDTIHDSTLLAALIGGRNEQDLTRARVLIDEFGGISGLKDAGIAELKRAGLTELRAVRLRAALLLAGRLEPSRPFRTSPFRSASQVHEHFRGRLADLKREQFLVVLLDARNRPFRDEIVSEGSLTASIVHPREAFTLAIRESAAAVLFVHNHPSGDPTPSRDDLDITDRLRKTGDLVGIRVVDHVIVAAHGYTSLAEQGWPKP